MCLHPSVSLNNEKSCHGVSEDKIAVCEKTAGLGNGNSSDLDSACFKLLVPVVKIFQIQDMLNENLFLDTFRGYNIRPTDTNFMFNVLKSNLRVCGCARNAQKVNLAK